MAKKSNPRSAPSPQSPIPGPLSGSKVAVLGAFGLMGEACLYDLAQSPEITEILAVDLNLSRKEAVLSRIKNRKKIVPLSLDCASSGAVSALKGSKVLVNCAWYELNLKAMDLALKLKAHYVDLGGLYHMTLKQMKKDAEFKKAGLLAVLGCGSTPGITNLMAKTLAEDFDRLNSVKIYDASHDPAASDQTLLPPFSIRTMLDEAQMRAVVFEDGKYRETPAFAEEEELDFPSPLGRCRLGMAIHSELATLPEYFRSKGIKQMFFKIYYPEVVKRQILLLAGMGLGSSEPVAVNGSQIAPRNLLTALSQKNWSRPQGEPRDFEVLRVKCEGEAKGSPLEKTLDCEITATSDLSAGAMGVGFTASIAAQMILQGRTEKAVGVFGPESCLDSRLFLKDLLKREVFKLVEHTTKPVGRTS